MNELLYNGTRLSIRCPVRFETDGVASMQVSSPRPAGLVFLLAMTPNRTVSVDHLVDQMWGNGELKNPRNALQAVVSRIRRDLICSLGEGAGEIIRRVPFGYRLMLDDAAVDATSFRRLVREGQDLSKIDGVGALAILRDALQLWSCYETPPVSGSTAIDLEVNSLNQTWLNAYEDYVSLAQVHDPSSLDIEKIRELSRRFPERERLCSLLMTSLYMFQRQAEAIQEFQRIKGSLDRDYGIRPGKSLHDALNTILQRMELSPHGNVARGWVA